MRRRVAVVGGTRFIGVAAVRELLGAGHEVLVAHRGEHELGPDPALDPVEHCHGDRDTLLTKDGPVERFEPELIIDTFGGGASATKGEQLVGAATRCGAERLVVVSSCDVYQAYVDAGLGDGSGRKLLPPTPLPISEDSPRRTEPYPGALPGHDNVAMEDAVAEFAGTVVILRPGAIYGPGDTICREWPLIRRALEKRAELALPAAGVQFFHRVAVERVAHALVAAVTASIPNKLHPWPCNVVDPYDWTYAGLAAEIGKLMDWEWEPKAVSFGESAHPWQVASPLLVSDVRLRDVLGVPPDSPDPRNALAATVRWYVENGPDPESPYLDW
ncbi:MAG: NAD-dependent epimerase/dehydratase family protein [Acidimicrobiia bacterium]|nr:NAD-dependent epimerase/dehydratase family protein [Acidimicrobiia bacterium]MYG71461.1 NAD-dependent epimerase/dehydratase family protein [Acidimicrobiia bacterium]MYH95215.1 NAD-dependent epimerase/dehydratase family protein [Acidimicrobiia bacterium]MYL09628.1 NAD-dependent epimerase/dehydratase family protein [Acidimicrobiia bacterium]